MVNNHHIRKNKLFLPIAVGSVIAVIAIISAAMLQTASAHNGFPNYADINKATKYQTTDTLKTSVTADAIIPKYPDSFIKSVLVYGYGWVDTNTGKAFTTLIHPNFRDSTKNPDKWHGHPVTLVAGTTKSNFCVGYIGDAESTAEGGISIDDATQTMKTSTSLAKLNGLKTENINTAASFIVQEDPDCPAIQKYVNGSYTMANLGVIVHSTTPVKLVQP